MADCVCFQDIRRPAVARRKANIRQLRRDYQLLCQMLKPIERIFWAIEQRRTQLADQLANEGVPPFCTPRRSIFEPGHTPVKVEKVKTK